MFDDPNSMIPPLPKLQSVDPKARKRQRILDLWSAGEKASVIAAQFGMSEGGIRSIINKERERGDERAVYRSSPRMVGDKSARDVCLDLWKAGASFSEIIAATGYRNAATVTTAIWRARQTGDPRAVVRRRGRKIGIRRENGQSIFRVSIPISAWSAIDAAALDRDMTSQELAGKLLAAMTSRKKIDALLDR